MIASTRRRPMSASDRELLPREAHRDRRAQPAARHSCSRSAWRSPSERRQIGAKRSPSSARHAGGTSDRLHRSPGHAKTRLGSRPSREDVQVLRRRPATSPRTSLRSPTAACREPAHGSDRTSLGVMTGNGAGRAVLHVACRNRAPRSSPHPARAAGDPRPSATARRSACASSRLRHRTILLLPAWLGQCKHRRPDRGSSTPDASPPSDRHSQGYGALSSATAWQAAPSPRPVKPRPSVPVARTETRPASHCSAPATRARISSR